MSDNKPRNTFVDYWIIAVTVMLFVALIGDAIDNGLPELVRDSGGIWTLFWGMLIATPVVWILERMFRK